MSHARNNGYYHFVWSTWDRVPLLTEEKEAHAHDLIRQQCKALKAEILALNGMPDHVHLFVKLPTTLTIADFMKTVKGGSARAFNEAYASPKFSFKWQGGYNYDTICVTHVPVIVRYIERQKQHHALGNSGLLVNCPTMTDPHPMKERANFFARAGGQSSPRQPRISILETGLEKGTKS